MKEDAYKYYGIFLAISVVVSFILNAVFSSGRGVADQFRRVPFTDVRREAEAVTTDVPPPADRDRRA